MKKISSHLISLICVHFIHAQYLNSEPNNLQYPHLLPERIVNTDGSNLRLRSKPSINSETIEKISNNSNVLFHAEEKEVINIHGKDGKWTKISYREKEGWVFSAFLIKIYKFSYEDDDPKHYCDIEKILETKFGKKGERIKFKPIEKNDETSKFKQNFNSDISLSTTMYLGGGYSTLNFPNKSMDSVYKIFSDCDSDLGKIEYEPQNDEFRVEFITDQSISKSFRFQFKNGNTTVFIGGQV